MGGVLVGLRVEDEIDGSGLELIRLLHWHERVSFFQSPCLYYSRGDPAMDPVYEPC